MALSLPAESTDLVNVPVKATTPQGPYDPTGDPLYMAFLPPGQRPQSPDWNPGQWQPGISGPGTYTAQCLVGPGSGVPLEAGTYIVWVKVTDDPEIPVRESGFLNIT